MTQIINLGQSKEICSSIYFAPLIEEGLTDKESAHGHVLLNAGKVSSGLF
jgi:hypothetical protein